MRELGMSNNIMDAEPKGGAQIESLKSLLTEILLTNSAYDCMPINSSICIIDKSVSLYDAINILISKNIEELLVWDENLCKEIWMLTLVDAIRFTTHALKSHLRRGFVDFSDFQKEKVEEGEMVSNISECSLEQVELVIGKLREKKLEEIISEISEQSMAKTYIRMKAVSKDSKISMVIQNMIVEKIHRIIIEDSQTHMYVSVLNFKDVFLYILRIANESSMTSYNAVNVSSLLGLVGIRHVQIEENQPLWEAFEIMTDREKSQWINVVDSERRFKGMLFREDFRDIFKGWHVDYLWMSVGEFVQWKASHHEGNVPEYRFFHPHDFTRDIIWKVLMTQRNAIVCLDSHGRVEATIGLLELFRLYVP